MSVQIIRIKCVLAHYVVGGLRAVLLIIIALVVGVVGHSEISHLHARHIAPALNIVRRKGEAEAEAHVELHAFGLFRIQAHAATVEMPDHLVFQAHIPQKEPLGPEGELGVQGRHIVVEGHIPPEIGVAVVFEDEAVEIAVGKQPKLGIQPETLVGEVIAEFQGQAIAVVAEDSGTELAVNVPVPRIAERLGKTYHSRMDFPFQFSVSVIEEGELELVCELHPRPERHFHGRTNLPKGLVHLIDDEVHYRHLGIHDQVHFAQGAGAFRLHLHYVPAFVELSGGAPASALRVVAHSHLRDVAAEAYQLHPHPQLRAIGLYYVSGPGKPLVRQLIGIAGQGKDQTVLGHCGAYVGEARILKPGYGPFKILRPDARKRDEQEQTNNKLSHLQRFIIDTSCSEVSSSPFSE